MNTILALIGCAAFGFAGWFLKRNPVRVLNFVFGRDESRHRPVQLFQVFGVVMMILAGLSAVMTVVSALLKAPA